jgi:hypothetical protein
MTNDELLQKLITHIENEIEELRQELQDESEELGDDESDAFDRAWLGGMESVANSVRLFAGVKVK